jgi:chromosome segregation ATPase
MTGNGLRSYLPKEPKEALAIVAACFTGLFIFGGDLWKLAGQARDHFRNEVRENMPVDLEINRARDLAASLVPDLRRNHEVIAREQAELDELKMDIRQAQGQLQEQRERVLALRSQLPSSSSSSSPSATEGIKTTADIRRELRHRFVVFQTAELTLEAKKEMMRCREEALAKSIAAQNEMLAKKKELEVQVAQLEVRIKLVQREGSENHIIADREKVARCEALLKYLRKRLTVSEKVSEFSGNEPTDTRTPDSEFAGDKIEIEIDQHFLSTSR